VGAGLDGVSSEPILAETHRKLYGGVLKEELPLAPVLAARTLIETDPKL
jgi:ribonucleoside-diphosphate reductase alpha chain